ncbi:ROK family protein [Borreliella lanei]|uniref:Putative NBD/HSP70 family sugar kinase n=1 Tax=Borreliella lanei TaxID=373540 RepID=A0A7X0DJ82_9SPIR|nr:ROK family protein [Borreliella lanei]MBB6207661.1 putative NBD/HSP70 family sugar kinase [Borreliella lanei]WKC86505.1 ROK family protein [Borreliella lanei]
MQGENMVSIRGGNRRKILLSLKNMQYSRTDLARKLSLTNAAVTILTNQMIKENLLIEVGSRVSDVKKHGRKEILLDINKDYAYSMGVIISSNYFQIGIANLKCEVLISETHSFEPPVSAYDILEKIKDHMIEIIWKHNFSRDKFIGLGFSITGLIKDKELGIVNDSYGAWIEKDVPVKRILEEYFSLTVYLESYVKNLSLAEFMGKNIDNIMFFDYTDTAELSIWSGGNVYPGFNNKSGMVSHMIIDYEGEKNCPTCGNKGCVNMLISNFALQRLISKEFMNGEIPELYEKYEGRLKKVTIYDIFSLYEKYDFINKIMQDTVKYLAIIIINIQRMLDFNYLVLYGQSFKLKAFFDLLKEEIKKLNKENIVLKLSSLDTEVSVVGPASSVIFNKFYLTGGDID